ncbi:MAG: hypothetical protein B6D37_02975 [Sphingobacteriales bacterium UTBCD1]|nr:MAG: hypothetical protein B6D37_02975 [Sphingobacteriales bacterium UTBCD1]
MIIRLRNLIVVILITNAYFRCDSYAVTGKQRLSKSDQEKRIPAYTIYFAVKSTTSEPGTQS